jgi:two-component system cell cycle response regulator
VKRKDSDTHDPSTDSITAARSGPGQERVTVAEWARSVPPETFYEAAVILIAHPENRRLGTRFALPPGGTLDLGRSPSAQICFPDIPSLSRAHARLRFAGGRVTIEDLGSRNGTFVNDHPVTSMAELRSGDRFQVGSLHFKFLHERDVEHAYHEAIYQMVMRDGLTEVFNQRKFHEEGAREVARALRHSRPLALVLFDIDHFKRINDTHGHLCGDSVLKQLAGRVEALLRPEQVFARVGGEEFAVLCPECELDGAAALAAKLRALFAEQPFECGREPSQVTCSFGVAAVDAGTSRLEDLVDAADRALYRAKNGGRDRVEVERPGSG